MSQFKIKRIAIMPSDLGPLPLSALEYLALRINTLQNEVQFEFLPVNKDFPFINKLRPNTVINMNAFRQTAPRFIEELDKFLIDTSKSYGLQPQLPDRYVIVSLSSLDSNYYELWENRYSAIFLGQWEDAMAPPSLLEFILTLIMIEGIGSIIQLDVNHISHLATRGCLADFNPTIRDVRNKTLQGFLCHDCKAILKRKIGAKNTTNWIQILEKEWIGQLSQPSSPASIVEKLGYNLFITRGLALSSWQKLMQSLKEDGVKELIKIVGSLILAGLLLWLGLKK
jgi:hypothetical protein